ncbi:unnamed protein product [Laminaria digitata]
MSHLLFFLVCFAAAFVASASVLSQLVSIDVNKVAEVPQRQKIKDLPTIQFFVEGKEVGSYVATDKGEAFYSNMERHLRAAQEDTTEE